MLMCAGLCPFGAVEMAHHERGRDGPEELKRDTRPCIPPQMPPIPLAPCACLSAPGAGRATHAAGRPPACAVPSRRSLYYESIGVAKELRIQYALFINDSYEMPGCLTYSVRAFHQGFL